MTTRPNSPTLSFVSLNHASRTSLQFSTAPILTVSQWQKTIPTLSELKTLNLRAHCNSEWSINRYQSLLQPSVTCTASSKSLVFEDRRSFLSLHLLFLLPSPFLRKGRSQYSEKLLAQNELTVPAPTAFTTVTKTNCTTLRLSRATQTFFFHNVSFVIVGSLLESTKQLQIWQVFTSLTQTRQALWFLSTLQQQPCESSFLLFVVSRRACMSLFAERRILN